MYLVADNLLKVKLARSNCVSCGRRERTRRLDVGLSDLLSYNRYVWKLKIIEISENHSY